MYNTYKNLRDDELEQMMTGGRSSLIAIVGVRRVFIGRALRDDAKYRYYWLVRFSSSSVSPVTAIIPITWPSPVCSFDHMPRIGLASTLNQSNRGAGIFWNDSPLS